MFRQMLAEFRTLSPQNQQDAIDLLNRTSADTSLKYDLDIFGFRWLARYWNFSYEHSLILYVDGEPAAVMLNSIQPETQDAYTFYWGALPRFRSQRFAISLFEAGCRKLHQDGYTTQFAVALPDRPVRRYRFVQLTPECELVDLHADSLSLPASDPRFLVREVDANDLPEQAFLPGEYQHWCQRPVFLRRAAPFLKFFAALAGEQIQAYATVLSQFPSMTLSDVRSPQHCSAAGFELLRALIAQDYYRPPLNVAYVFENSYAYRLLTAAGFAVKRRFSVLRRDLRTTCETNQQGPRIIRSQSEPAPVEQSSPKVAS